MDLKLTIVSAEKQYKQILEEFFVSVYAGETLSSHGIDHHKRVWNYSKELIELIPHNSRGEKNLAEQLIIASYLHDIGMSFDPGVKHGKHSKALCQLFLSQNNIPENAYPDLLEAIENHDDKEYITGIARNELLRILSVADDLDAFGYVGIYRYAEIYLTRGIEKSNIGSLIIKNAAKRFENFELTFGNNPELIKKHRERFLNLHDFFTGYNEQLHSYQFGTNCLSGYCGVIELFEKMIKNKTDLKEFLRTNNTYNDTIINHLLEELRNEITE